MISNSKHIERLETLIGRHEKSTVCEGDQGGPITYWKHGREFLAGIAPHEVPKYNLRGRNVSEYFCGPTNEIDGDPIPAKYVKTYFLLSWMLRDHSKPEEGNPIREEVFDCLVEKPADKNSIPQDVSPIEIKKRPRPKE